jgi:hypothetical protein
MKIPAFNLFPSKNAIYLNSNNIPSDFLDKKGSVEVLAETVNKGYLTGVKQYGIFQRLFIFIILKTK